MIRVILSKINKACENTRASRNERRFSSKNCIDLLRLPQPRTRGDGPKRFLITRASTTVFSRIAVFIWCFYVDNVTFSVVFVIYTSSRLYIVNESCARENFKLSQTITKIYRRCRQQKFCFICFSDKCIDLRITYNILYNIILCDSKYIVRHIYASPTEYWYRFLDSRPSNIHAKCIILCTRVCRLIYMFSKYDNNVFRPHHRTLSTKRIFFADILVCIFQNVFHRCLHVHAL